MMCTASAATSAGPTTRSSRSHFVGRVARDVKCQQEVLADKIANLREVHIGEASVVRPTGCHHHVVDCREVTEEPIESNRIRGVETPPSRAQPMTYVATSFAPLFE